MPSSSPPPIAPLRPGLLALLLFLSPCVRQLPPGLLSAFQLPVVAAREIVATRDWQRLGENDTVPAGLHIKMDLTTGEKWARIRAEPDGTGEEGATATARGGGVASVEMSASGALSVVETADGLNAAHGEGERGEETEPAPRGKDYDMMHRVMSQLPPEELARFGGLPGLAAPDGAAPAPLTDAERLLYEQRMEQLWQARQEELARIQEDEVADMPKMLQARIRVLKEHLEDVPGGLRRIIEGRRVDEEHRAEEENVTVPAKDEEEKDGASEMATDVVAALRDLEYQLSDVDMARDFHTLGGWPYLVALLHDGDAGGAGDAMAVDEEGNGDELPILADEIRALAAMAIGTAVGNVGEFRGWALEDVPAARGARGEVSLPPTSALATLVASFHDEADRRARLATAGMSAARRRARATSRLRAAYALGSLARGNPAATRSLVAARGADALARDALGATPAANDAALLALEYKFASKALALAEDVVVGVVLHEEEYAPAHGGGAVGGDDALTANQLVAAFTTERWCDLSLRLLAPPVAALGAAASRRTKERALSAVRALAPGCQARSGGAEEAAAWGVEEVRSVRSEWNREGSGDGLDSTYRRELLELVDGVLEVLQ